VSFGSPLLLVHVIESIPVTGGRHESIEAHKRAVVADAGDRLQAFASALPRGASLETHLGVGSPAAQIAAIAADRHAGLIVMGLHAEGGGRVGAVAYGVLCLVKVPVLALPGRSHVSPRQSPHDNATESHLHGAKAVA
jgi:nucleotide-binding universal stress UspA family protein